MGGDSRAESAVESNAPEFVCNFNATTEAALKAANSRPVNSFQNYKSAALEQICFLEFCCEIQNRWKSLKLSYLQTREPSFGLPRHRAEIVLLDPATIVL